MFINNINPVLVSIFGLEIRYYGLIYVLGFLLILFILNRDDISDVLMISGGIILSIIAILFLVDFNLLFTKFHEILFSNNYWLLDENTLLIRTYPFEFFTGFFRRLVLNIIISSLILITIGATKHVYTQYKSSHD